MKKHLREDTNHLRHQEFQALLREGHRLTQAIFAHRELQVEVLRAQEKTARRERLRQLFLSNRYWWFLPLAWLASLELAKRW